MYLLLQPRCPVLSTVSPNMVFDLQAHWSTIPTLLNGDTSIKSGKVVGEFSTVCYMLPCLSTYVQQIKRGMRFHLPTCFKLLTVNGLFLYILFIYIYTYIYTYIYIYIYIYIHIHIYLDISWNKPKCWSPKFETSVHTGAQKQAKWQVSLGAPHRWPSGACHGRWRNPWPKPGRMIIGLSGIQIGIIY